MSIENKKKYKYLFGPVASRRLGISLGVDLVPYKTCSMDCLYCESGSTTDLRLDRSELFPTSDIISELDDFLSQSPNVDYLTFSGAGEPTLHSGIGEIIQFVKKKHSNYKIALLTNSMMLMDPQLFKEILPVDLIVPSLDSAIPEQFLAINKPCIPSKESNLSSAKGIAALSLEKLIKALAKFKRESNAIFNLEVFVIPGVNNSQKSIDAMVDAVDYIKPDLVQLNTLDRPGVESWVKPASIAELEFFASYIAKVANVEVVGEFKKEKINKKSDKKRSNKEMENEIFNLVERRPSTSLDVSIALECEESLISSILEKLVFERKLTIEQRSRGTFYKKNKKK